MNTGIGEFIRESRIAYFSMEIGVRSDMPTYSGGLGVLAGDTIKSAADLKLPMVAVTILTKKGYFKQEIDKDGRHVHIVSWLYIVESAAGGKVPIIFLDTDIPDNKSEDREITHYLYGGNEVYRLKQEIVLGIGGIRMLDRLGFEIKKYHMNEGHSSLLVLELLKKYRRDIEEVWDEKLIWDIEKVRNLCVFTTHTPIAAGHDKFSYELLQNILSDGISINLIKEFAGGEYLNMTLLALNLSRYINGVAKRHGEVSKGMFPGYEIHAITNGVHSFTWTCDSFKKLYDKYLPGWANEPETFVRIGRIPDDELWNTHMEAKRHLIDYVNQETHTEMNYDILTIGFARRVTAYKRADLLFTDMERLARIGNGKIQIIYAGKAHPKDEPGKMLIKRIIEIKERLDGRIKIIFLKNYNIDLALKLVSSVDVLLNTPQRPLEASGTSGMKASHNGVPNFSVLDGWWIEGHIEGYTGWSIGPSLDTATDLQKDADDLYYKLENIIIPTFYNDRRTWIRIMQNAIGKNAYYFNSHRMMRRYVTEAYIR